MAYASDATVALGPDDLAQFGSTIRQDSFINRTDVVSVTFPSSIKCIEESSFYGCKNLKRVVFPPHLERIGKDAFQHCSSITVLELPASLRAIGDQAFMGCRELHTVNYPPVLEQNLKHVGQKLFTFCNKLKKPSTGKSLQDVRVHLNEADFAAFGKVLWPCIGAHPPHHITSRTTLSLAPSNSLSSPPHPCWSLFIHLYRCLPPNPIMPPPGSHPPLHQGHVIPEDEFKMRQDIGSVVLPETIKKIGPHAFYRYV